MKTVDDTARELGCVPPHEQEHLDQQRYERDCALQRKEQELQYQQQQQQQPEHGLKPTASIAHAPTTSSATSSSSSSSSRFLPPTEKINEVASTSLQEAKTMLNAACESELVNSAVRRVREYVPGFAGGDAEGEKEEHDPLAADPEEIRRIEALEKERIVEFLQDRTRSNRDLEKKYHPGKGVGSAPEQ
ncbi:uncharacterized protein BO97DRAFT_480264 [Aspergillus homomorphus CBS 101889]|uniref:Uncharacterized protein n=1 Tax=Aspergillus homomorphus (strain CBS 101889) TaxID=1450537 RepID=A0A395HM55_ASPHC|nr:hypothetical protein BO97DRAFT_480264 [Aspergillus homomorphus CBS 101889]RAL08927.1 hypothetical protein BO97DRAFT_480264 [Aspergillus homomorphus CBS 101889]